MSRDAGADELDWLAGEAGWPVPFERFMERALYHPAHGYYAAPHRTVGRRGDFFTSVSVGRLFGTLMALDFADRWEALGSPARFTVVEQGAHDGAFAADVLAAAEGPFAEALRYVVVEPLPHRERSQRDRLGCDSRVSWASALGDLEPWEGIHWSNELIDAFPVRRVRHSGGRWRERWVAKTGAGLGWTDGPEWTPDRPLPVSEGYTTEARCADGPWLRAVAAGLRRGWVITVDYGLDGVAYDDPARADGTLRSYRGHRMGTDVLDAPGMQDLTAHVHWTRLGELAVQAGLAVEECADQARFLVPLAARWFGRGEIGTRDPGGSLRRQFQTLAHPGMMGSRFQRWIARKGLDKQARAVETSP